MGTITAGEIVVQCQELAQDESGDIWTAAEGVAWVNDAQRAIAIARIDASVSRGSMQLVPGIKQSITGRRLVAVHYNLGSDGATVGLPVRLIERGIKDESDPLWTTETAATQIFEYMYDEDNPKNFDVSPPVHASTQVHIEVTQGVDPTDCADLNSTIDLDDIYVPAIIEWVMYRFFGRDSEETPNHQRAISYFGNFFHLLGVKIKSDMFSSPHMRNQLEKGDK